MQTAPQYTPTYGTQTLPAALFDEIKKRADAAGGIGYGAGHGSVFPRCIGDFAAAIDGREALNDTYVANEFTSQRTPAVTALITALGDNYGNRNDAAVARLNRSKGSAYDQADRRVSFDELVAELGLVRGEA